jgi:hypothetical protein
VTSVRRVGFLLVAVTFVLAGCNAPTSRETSGPKELRPGDLVAIEGAAPIGRFFVKAGADDLAADLYRVSFSPPTYARLTTDERVTTVGGCEDRVIVAAAQRKVGYVDTLQEFRAGKLTAVEGLGMERGSVPELSEDCRFLYLKPKDQDGDLIQQIQLFDPTTGSTSTVVSDADVYGASWGPGGEILVLHREPTGPRLEVIRPDGGRSEIDPQAPDVGNTQWGRTGWIAMAVFREPRLPPTSSLLLNPASGERVTLDGWLPLAWSPSGDQLLVRDAEVGTTLAVVETTNLTKTRNVGASEVGPIWDAVWLTEKD